MLGGGGIPILPLFDGQTYFVNLSTNNIAHETHIGNLKRQHWVLTGGNVVTTRGGF